MGSTLSPVPVSTEPWDFPARRTSTNVPLLLVSTEVNASTSSTGQLNSLGRARAIATRYEFIVGCCDDLSEPVALPRL